MKLNKNVLGAACACAVSVSAMTISTDASAANWLMLQGTEPASAAERMKMWGFIQAQYQKDYSKPCASAPCADQFIPPKLIGPNLESQEQFNVNRARIGARGTGFPLDSKVNYFILAEFGNNAITEGSNSFAKMTDASITLNHIPGARVRVGLFKTPGAEEHLQAIHVFDYIEFTQVTNQMLLERIPGHRNECTLTDVTGTDTDDPADGNINTITNNYRCENQNLFPPGQGGVIGAEQNGFANGVSAFRDVGIQIFDAFTTGAWEHSYAVMYGNGNGMNLGDNDDNKDLYLYLSTEWVMGGNGPRREGLKIFAWNQDGKRTYDLTSDNVFNPETYDRKRQGFGAKYLKKPFRVTAEYMKGEGLIFVGPDKPSFDQNGGTAANGGDGIKGKASGYYLDLGWYIPKTNWELDLRYDVYNRLEDDKGNTAGSLESEWLTTTVGAQYHFNKKTRFTLNYTTRDVKTPDLPSTAPPNKNMNTIENRLGLQLTHIF